MICQDRCTRSQAKIAAARVTLTRTIVTLKRIVSPNVKGAGADGTPSAPNRRAHDHIPTLD